MTDCSSRSSSPSESSSSLELDLHFDLLTSSSPFHHLLTDPPPPPSPPPSLHRPSTPLSAHIVRLRLGLPPFLLVSAFLHSSSSLYSHPPPSTSSSLQATSLHHGGERQGGEGEPDYPSASGTEASDCSTTVSSSTHTTLPLHYHSTCNTQGTDRLLSLSPRLPLLPSPPTSSPPLSQVPPDASLDTARPWKSDSRDVFSASAPSHTSAHCMTAACSLHVDS